MQIEVAYKEKFLTRKPKVEIPLWKIGRDKNLTPS